MKIKQGIFTALIAGTFFLYSAATASANISEYVEGEVLVTLYGSYSINLFNAQDEDSQSKSIAARMSEIAPSGTKTIAAYNALSSGSGTTMACLKSETKTTKELIDEISGKAGVLGVYPNYIRELHEAASAPNDSMYNAKEINRWGYEQTNAVSVWADGVLGSSNVVAAVIDSGVKYDHHDLKGNIAVVSGLTGNLSIFNNSFGAWFSNGAKSVFNIGIINGNSYNLTYDESKIRGRNLPYSDKRLYGDINGHGTHVAGIIGAIGNNSIGIAGMNKYVKLLPVNVVTLDKKTGKININDSDIIKGLQYVYVLNKLEGSSLKGKVKVANISIGGWNDPGKYYNINNPYANALKLLGDSGVIVCISSGNDSQNINNPGTKQVIENGKKVTLSFIGKLPFPAAFGSLPGIKNVIVVGAAQYNPNGKDKLTRADYSNYSNPGAKDSVRYVDIMAPGTNIFSTVPLYDTNGVMRGLRYNKTLGKSLSSVYLDKADTSAGRSYPGYEYKSGTSMAAPMVSGAVALLASKYPNASASEIKDMICSGANPKILKKGVSTYGFLDVKSSVRRGGSIKFKNKTKTAASSLMSFLSLVDKAEMNLDVSNDIKSLGLSNMFEEEDGVCYVSYDLAYDIADTLTANSNDEFYGVESLPAFSLVSGDGATFQSGDIVSSSFDLEALWFGETVGELRMAKAKASSPDALPLTYTMSADSKVDGTYCVSRDGRVLYPSEDISSDDDALYEVRIFTADNGKYDLNSADGKILDATVMYNFVVAQTEEADIPEPVSEEPFVENPEDFAYEERSSGGGCNAGFAGLALLAVIPVVLRRKK